MRANFTETDSSELDFVVHVTCENRVNEENHLADNVGQRHWDGDPRVGLEHLRVRRRIALGLKHVLLLPA